MEFSDGQPTKRAGLTRRDIIKRSAIAGGVVWTAPVILDSVLSPAAAQSAPCVCTTCASYTGGKVEELGGGTGGSCTGGVTVPGSLGFTGNSSSSNRCGALCWVAVNGCTPSGAGGAPSFDCATYTVKLPGNCNFGAKGMVAVFGGGSCTGNFFVESNVAPYGSCSPNFGSAMLATAQTFVLPVGVRGNLSHVNVVYCCC